MRVARGFDQLDERAQKSPHFTGDVGCAGLFQQPANALGYDTSALIWVDHTD